MEIVGVRITLRDFPVEELLWGLGLATLALVVAAFLTRGRAGPWGEPDDRERYRVAVPGLLVTAAALGAVGRTWPVTASTVVGLAGVTVPAVWLTRRPRGGTAWLAGLGVMVPPAYLLAADASSTAWVRGLLVAGLVAGVPAASRTDVGYGPVGLTPVLYAVSAAGVFAAVPDTEQAAALLGASVPLAVRGWPLGRGRLGPPGAGAAAALLLWVAAVGGRGREPSIVGAVGCLGLLLTLPAGQWLAGRAGRLRAAGRSRRHVLPLVLVHLVAVAVASRVAGVSSDLRFASVVTAAILLVALAASVLLAARSP
ncbi:MAG TPA: hypothetical protein VFM27_19625 [Acidimicrobiales bacterium]|nr:hypothetical protein [Acidimicrobiales bacterium]